MKAPNLNARSLIRLASEENEERFFAISFEDVFEEDFEFEYLRYA